MSTANDKKPVLLSARAQALEKEKYNDWIKDFDFEGFHDEVKALGKKMKDGQGPDDVNHLKRMIQWSNNCAAVGLLTMGFGVNFVSVLGLSLYTFSRWTMIAHHTCHGGYQDCHPERRGRFSRFKFGLGTLWRRWNDWFDWMMPEAWNIEHNQRHHYNLSEITDPDLVEQNLVELREMNAPMIFKYLFIAFNMLTWKWFYYSPNTYKELKLAQWRKEGRPIPKDVAPEDAITIKGIIFGQNPFYSFSELFFKVLGPYLLFHFFVCALPYYFLGEQSFMNEYGYTGKIMYCNALKNLFLADLLTNLHGFIAVVTNHAGDEMYRFRYACRPYSGSFFLRQVLASVDYSYGKDYIDFWHGWLNYQVEHHLWPNLSMLSYQRCAPEVRAICEKYNVPYVQENVLWRTKKTVDIMTGKTSMRWFPEASEKDFLERDLVIERKEKEKNAKKKV